MTRKIVLAVGILGLVGAIGVFLWARSVFTRDAVRTALAAQISEVLGQPVTIGTIGAGLLPRVTVDLGDVTIGNPVRIRITSLHVGTDLRALVSRRIEHARLRVNGARIDLPLPPLSPRAQGTRGTGGTPGTPGTPGTLGTQGTLPVTLVSIDEIALHDIQLVSGGHAIHGEIDAAPTDAGIALNRITLTAAATRLEGRGVINDLGGPVGTISLRADELDLDRLLAVLSAFSAGASVAAGSGPSDAKPDLTIALESGRAKTGSLVLETLAGRAHVSDRGVVLEPLGFGLFGGRHDGRLALAVKDGSPSFRGRAVVSGLDMAALTRFAGSGEVITGRLSAKVDLEGAGGDLAAAVRSLGGAARVDIADGVVRNLNLVRNVVLATSGRADSTAVAAAENTGGERFSRLGATLVIAGGVARTTDLQFTSPDVDLAAGGTVALNGSAVDLAGIVQLSPALSKQSGRDLYRYTSVDGRVTLPAAISGPAASLSVRIDLARATERALRNKLNEELDRAIRRNLGGLFKKPPL